MGALTLNPETKASAPGHHSAASDKEFEGLAHLTRAYGGNYGLGFRGWGGECQDHYSV